MNLTRLSIKLVRWTSIPLLLLLGASILTGYTTSGRFGLGKLMDEQSALAWHKMLHLPLFVLLLAHLLPAAYLTLVRWRWIKPARTPGPVDPGDTA